MTGERYGAAELERFCEGVLVSLGMEPADAGVAADSLVRANLEGTDSHGVSRLPIYARRIREGRISARPEVLVERSGAVVRVDGGNGLGQVVSVRALEAAMPVARELGLTGVAVRRSNHFGTAAYYCQMACREGMGLIATTNSPPGIAPWGGREAYLGTNPIAFGFPTREGPPLISDMSSSVVARGRVILAAARGEEIPEGWATDAEGVPTTDAAAALKGAMLPLGGPKGYALAMAVEVLSGVLTGSGFGPGVNNLYREGDPPADVGHSFVLLNIEHWLPVEVYHERMEWFLAEVGSSPRAKGFEEVLYPGERRNRTRQTNEERGISLPEEVRGELARLGEQCGVPFPEQSVEAT